VADRWAVFVARTEHPIWPHLQLVIWRMDDGSWSHDALLARQDVGAVTDATPDERRHRLREAMLRNPDEWRGGLNARARECDTAPGPATADPGEKLRDP
jgi:hypothetical protein